MYSKPDSAAFYADLQFQFAKKKKLKKEMAQALLIKGSALFQLGDYDGALDHFNQCLILQESLGDKRIIASTKSRMGEIYERKGDYATAIEYYNHCLSLYHELEYEAGVALILNNLGIIYRIQGDYKTATKYLNESLDIKEKRGDQIGTANTLLNIGVVYKANGELDKSLACSERALIIFSEIEYKRGEATSLHNLGELYFMQGIYDKAHTYLKQSLQMFEDLEVNEGVAQALDNLGKVYYETNKLSQAISNSQRSLKIGEELGAITIIAQASKSLYLYYRASGNYSRSLEMYELYVELEDSIISEKNQKETIRQAYKYEYEKQAIADSVAYIEIEKVQQAKLEKSRIMQYALICGLVLVIGFLTYVYNRFKVARRQKQIISKQNQKLAAATEVTELANKELKTKSVELEEFNNKMLDREMRIIELKEEANKLAKGNNMELPYPEVGES